MLLDLSSLESHSKNLRFRMWKMPAKCGLKVKNRKKGYTWRFSQLRRAVVWPCWLQQSKVEVQWCQPNYIHESNNPTLVSRLNLHKALTKRKLGKNVTTCENMLWFFLLLNVCVGVQSLNINPLLSQHLQLWIPSHLTSYLGLLTYLLLGFPRTSLSLWRSGKHLIIESYSFSFSWIL